MFKIIVDYWWVGIFLLAIIILPYNYYEQENRNHKRAAECILNYDFYSLQGGGSIKKYCINPTSNKCKEFLGYNNSDGFQDFYYSCYDNDIGNGIEYKSPIISCLNNNKIHDLYKKINYSNYDKVMNGLSDIEKKAKNCVYLNY